MVQIYWGGGVYEPCLSVVKLKGVLGVFLIIGTQRNYGAHCCDGERCWLCYGSGYIRASSLERKNLRLEEGMSKVTPRSLYDEITWFCEVV